MRSGTRKPAARLTDRTGEKERLLREKDDALERARRQARELQILNQIARIATEGLELRPMLQRITDALAEKLDWEFVACVTVDEGSQCFVCEAVTSRHPTDVFVGYSRPLGSGVVGEVAATGVPMLLDDVRAHANYVETLPGAVSELCYPVKYGGRLIAIINLESTRPAAFHDQAALLETVAEQVAGVIASARLFEEVRRRAGHLAMIGEISRAAMESGDLQPLLDRVVAYVQSRLGLSLVAVLLLTEEGREDLEMVAWAGTVPLNVSRGAKLPAGRGLIGLAMREGAPRLVLDVRRDPDYVMVNPDVVAEFDVPIRFQGELLGVMNLESTAAAAFSPENLELVRTLTEQVAGAIATARLHEELKRRAGALEMVSQVSRRAMEATELQTLLDRVVAFIQERLGFPLVAILLARDEGRGLQNVAFAQKTSPRGFARGDSWPAERGIIGRALRRGTTQLVLDVREDPDYVSSNDRVAAELAIPIRFQDSILGVMNMESEAASAFTEETVTLLHTIADQVAGAIHMASMNRRLTEANRMLSELFSRYVAPDLAEKLLEDPDRFRTGGERREVSVLFADIRGFTGLSQRLDSQKVLALLNDYYSAMGEVIFAHRGSINRILGDGLLAVFGVPEAIASHARAAVAAARDMQSAVARLSPGWQEITGDPLRIAVAVNCGEVIVGTVGDPRHMEFTVLGDVVNVASRLEREAKERDVPILITGTVVEEMSGSSGAEWIGNVELRGRQGGVALYRLK